MHICKKYMYSTPRVFLCQRVPPDQPLRLDMTMVGHAFAQADSDNDGKISLEANGSRFFWSKNRSNKNKTRYKLHRDGFLNKCKQMHSSFLFRIPILIILFNDLPRVTGATMVNRSCSHDLWAQDLKTASKVAVGWRVFFPLKQYKKNDEII